MKPKGRSEARLLRIWKGMCARCRNPNLKEYKLYGGRGIRVCDEWTDSYEPFRDWALANGYRDDLTIDRIDNDGNYEPENCRWATHAEQARNRSSNHLLTYGKTQLLQAWAEEVGLRPETIRRRLKLGWSVERALTEPLHPQAKLTEAQVLEIRQRAGTATQVELAREYGVAGNTVCRIQSGSLWPHLAVGQ
jgi:hypothetical protein